MNKGKEVEVIDLLEDIIGELSGSYVTGTGKDGIPKRLFQVIDYFNGKTTDAKERIFTPKELKLIADNKRAKAVIEKAYNIYNKRIEYGKDLQSRIYGCYSQKSYINSVESVYLKELESSISDFCQNHNSETVIKPELIGKYFGSMESNRISSNIKKQDTVNPLYKEYGSFLDRMDKGTVSAQNKEKIPQKILAYKLQYLLTKTKIMDAINTCMKNIEVDISSKKVSPTLTILGLRSGPSSLNISANKSVNLLAIEEFSSDE